MSFDETKPTAAPTDATTTTTPAEVKPASKFRIIPSMSQAGEVGMFGYNPKGSGIIKKVNLWQPICIPTGIPGFDQLLWSEYHGNITHGIPVGHPTFVMLDGGPGSGKSMILYNITARWVGKKLPVLFMSFEKSAQTVSFHVNRIIENLGLPVQVINDGKTIEIPGLSLVDNFAGPRDNRTFGAAKDMIQEWVTTTKGQLIMIDSVTDMVMGIQGGEAQLRIQLKKLLADLATFQAKNGTEFAIIGTTQHRGFSRDTRLAGGMAMGHLSAVIITTDSFVIDNFNMNRFRGIPRGTEVHTIKVAKTQDVVKSPHEFMFGIEENGVVEIGEAPIHKLAMTCAKCGEYVDPQEEDFIAFKKGKGIRHLDGQCQSHATTAAVAEGTSAKTMKKDWRIKTIDDLAKDDQQQELAA